eukprot:Gb_30206 [translate_table: standard]
MLLGKRPRPPMRRTTSMTLLGSDCSIDSPLVASPKEKQKPCVDSSLGESPKEKKSPTEDCPSSEGMALEAIEQGRIVTVDVPIHIGVLQSVDRFAQVGSPRIGRKKGGDMTETAHFLQACFLCKRRLGPGRDIYMYRGDSAFCSVECRHQQIVVDERKEKCSVEVMKKESVPANHHQSSGNQNVQAETVAAA